MFTRDGRKFEFEDLTIRPTKRQIVLGDVTVSGVDQVQMLMES